MVPRSLEGTRGKDPFVPELAEKWLANTALWRQNLNLISGFTDALAKALHNIDEKGMRKTIADIK